MQPSAPLTDTSSQNGQGVQIQAEHLIDELAREVARLTIELATARVVIRGKDQEIAQLRAERG